MSSFWLTIIKQQKSIKEISTFSNSGQGCQTQFWKGPRTISAKFALVYFSGFTEEDLNVKVYDGQTNDRWRMPSDGKS